MGIDMEVVYLGFAGSAQIESEAAAQLVRLQRFGKAISGCQLAIVAIHGRGVNDLSGARPGVPGATSNHLMFEARLELIMRTGQRVPLEHRQSADADGAIRTAFDAAARLLEWGVARV
jgi:hypothetical protein